MIFCKYFFMKNTATPLYAIMVAAVLMTGCIVDPVTGQSRPDPKIIGALGAVAGGVAGGFLGNKVGGRQGAALGAAIGVGLGGAAGYFISDYLNAREQQQYLASLSQQMKALPSKSGGSSYWQNADHSRSVSTTFGPVMSLQQISAKSGNQIPIDQQLLASLPSNPRCREANSTFRKDSGQSATMPVVTCRTAEGDYIPISGAST